MKVRMTTLSDRLVPPVDELVAHEEVVSSWRLCVCASRNSFNISQRWANCCMSASVTALIWRSTSSDLTASLDDLYISGPDILLEVCASKLSVSVLLSFSSLSTATELFIYQDENSCSTVKKCWFSRTKYRFQRQKFYIFLQEWIQVF